MILRDVILVMLKENNKKKAIISAESPFCIGGSEIRLWLVQVCLFFATHFSILSADVDVMLSFSFASNFAQIVSRVLEQSYSQQRALDYIRGLNPTGVGCEVVVS